jgi:hypothetical protein
MSPLKWFLSVGHQPGRTLGYFMDDDHARDGSAFEMYAPDLTVTWRESDAPGSMERHLKLLEMLFGPIGGTDEAS